MTDSHLKNWMMRANMVADALPFMQRYHDKSVVIKYGGHAMGDGQLSKNFARDVVLLKQCGVHPVIVHGGGPQIGEMLSRLKIESSFDDGLRRTDQPTMQIAEMVLSGSINKRIVADINYAGGHALGISGKDCHLIKARKLTRKIIDSDSHIEKLKDFGFVGEPEKIDPTILQMVQKSNIIPVIAPIGFGSDGQSYNINADTAAGAIATTIKAARLLLLSDVDGIFDQDGSLIQQILNTDIDQLIEKKIATDGMIPKLLTCKHVVENNVDAAVILNGKYAHAILLELFSPLGFGTLIKVA
ncbi:MAG: acetylglutamate kinase [Pseudomonadota bacterium]